jgi:hypothetical protein
VTSILLLVRNGQIFKQAANIFKAKHHLKVNGFKELLRIRATINLGLSDELKLAFPNVLPVDRPLIKDLVVKSLIGFQVLLAEMVVSLFQLQSLFLLN